jgi:hypothetical protein
MRTNRDGVVRKVGAGNVFGAVLARNELGFTSRHRVLTLKDTAEHLGRCGAAR